MSDITMLSNKTICQHSSLALAHNWHNWLDSSINDPILLSIAISYLLLGSLNLPVHDRVSVTSIYQMFPWSLLRPELIPNSCCAKVLASCCLDPGP